MRRRLAHNTLFLAAALLIPCVARAQTGATRGPADLTPFARAKAEAILQDQLPCLGCHTLDGKGGKLAPELATVRSRRDAAYVARVVVDPQATVAGTLMPHTPMPHEWRVLIVRCGGSLAGTVFSYQGAPNWLLITVDPAHRADLSSAQLVMDDGRQVPLNWFHLDPSGSSGGGVPVDPHQVSVLRLLPGAGGQPLVAHFSG